MRDEINGGQPSAVGLQQKRKSCAASRAVHPPFRVGRLRDPYSLKLLTSTQAAKPKCPIIRASRLRECGDHIVRARGRLIPFNLNSPTGSALTASSTAINTRGLVRICPGLASSQRREATLDTVRWRHNEPTLEANRAERSKPVRYAAPNPISWPSRRHLSVKIPIASRTSSATVLLLTALFYA
jgi:hypothetical protein